MKTHEEIKSKLFKNPEIKAEYDALALQYELISQMILARNEQGLTQAALAERTGIQRSNISRLESGNYNPSLEILNKIAKGLGKELHIEFRSPNTQVH